MKTLASEATQAKSLIVSYNPGLEISVVADCFNQATPGTATDRSSILLINASHQDCSRVRRIWNGMVDRKLSLIVRCSSPGDLRETWQLAKSKGLRGSVRCGGHNPEQRVNASHRPAKHQRASVLKAIFDPDSFFCLNHNIKPAMAAGVARA